MRTIIDKRFRIYGETSDERKIIKDLGLNNHMISAGEQIIWEYMSGCDDQGAFFSAKEMAVNIYKAMIDLKK